MAIPSGPNNCPGWGLRALGKFFSLLVWIVVWLTLGAEIFSQFFGRPIEFGAKMAGHAMLVIVFLGGAFSAFVQPRETGSSFRRNFAILLVGSVALVGLLAAAFAHIHEIKAFGEPIAPGVPRWQFILLFPVCIAWIAVGQFRSIAAPGTQKTVPVILGAVVGLAILKIQPIPPLFFWLAAVGLLWMLVMGLDSALALGGIAIAVAAAVGTDPVQVFEAVYRLVYNATLPAVLLSFITFGVLRELDSGNGIKKLAHAIFGGGRFFAAARFLAPPSPWLLLVAAAAHLNVGMVYRWGLLATAVLVFTAVRSGRTSFKEILKAMRGARGECVVLIAAVAPIASQLVSGVVGAAIGVLFVFRLRSSRLKKLGLGPEDLSMLDACKNSGAILVGGFMAFAAIQALEAQSLPARWTEGSFTGVAGAVLWSVAGAAGGMLTARVNQPLAGICLLLPVLLGLAEGSHVNGLWTSAAFTAALAITRHREAMTYGSAEILKNR